jgi:hypothetical protein
MHSVVLEVQVNCVSSTDAGPISDTEVEGIEAVPSADRFVAVT